MGQFVCCKMSGVGLKYISMSDFTLGTWFNETLQGSALEKRKGGIYIGNYELEKLLGNMTYIEASGVRYVGEWVKGLKHGRGVESYPAEFQAGQWTKGYPAQGQYHYVVSFRLQ